MSRVISQNEGRLIVLVRHSRKDGVAAPDFQVDAGVELKSTLARVVDKIEGFDVVCHACDCVVLVAESMYALYRPVTDTRKTNGWQ